ncbi:MAG: FG-GAP-like repeat-containing protein [Syntrophobacteraceae bacterium]
MSLRKPIFLFPLLLLILVGLARPCAGAAPTGDVPVKIAILPFSMHTPAELNYLQSGVRDMLTSRLAWQGKVQIVDRSQTEQAAKGFKDITINDATRIGNNLKADYVLFGSITGMGQSVSIDAKIVPLSGKAEPVAFYAQTKSLDDVIPQVNNFAQQINTNIFAKPGDKSQSAASEAEMLATRNPEFLLPGALVSGDKISYLNPNFIEVTPEGALRQPGIWRSQTFEGGIIGMDVGDLDGDGKTEIVAITYGKLTVYRKEANGLRTIGTFEGRPVDRFVWVAVSDIYKDGKAYIYLTNLRKKNSSRGIGEKQILEQYSGEDVSSYVLSASGGKVQVVAEAIPYFLNTVHLGQRGKVVVGQKKGETTEGAFKGAVMEMQLRGKSLNPTTPITLPESCNLFNFVKADINNDKMEEIILVDGSHRLVVLNQAGDQIWKGSNVFSATTNTFEAKIEDLRFNRVDLFFIPSPILVTDMNKDGILELVLNRNLSSMDRFLPDSMKAYEKGEVISLSWDQLGMVENWKTREFSGMVTSVRIGDLMGDGNKQLIVSMVLAKDLLKVWDAKSTIITYDLNIGAAPPPKAAEVTPAKGPDEGSGKPAIPGRSTTKKK